jgi:hypothetical protein
MDAKINPRINVPMNIIVGTLFKGILPKKGLVNKLEILGIYFYLSFK